MADVTFSNLDETAVDDYAALLVSQLSEAYPGINFARGTAIYDLVIDKAARAHVYESETTDALGDYWNVAAIAADPEAVSPAQVDQLLSNFNATRAAGAKAGGQVEVVLSSAVSLTVSSGTVFRIGDLVFLTTTSCTVIIQESSRTSDDDRLLVARSNGTYTFRLDVIAQLPGAAGNVKLGTAATMEPQPLYYVSANAAEDFSGGTDEEDNTTFVTRARAGLTAQLLSSPQTTAAFLSQSVAGYRACSVIGLQHPEMRRDRLSLLGGSVGGRADVYLRASEEVQTALYVKTATCTSAEDHRWTVSLTRDELAGAYRVFSVVRNGEDWASRLDIEGTAWTYDTSNLDFPPQIASDLDGAFSSYQAAVVTFIDPNDLGTYDVRVQQTPNIAAAQALCSDEANRDPMADWLVRAAVPVLVSINMKVRAPAGVTVDTDAVAAAVAEAINAQSFVQELSASIVVAAAQSAMPAGAYVHLPLTMIGTILRPDRTSTLLRSGNALVIPDLPEAGVTWRTCAFFAAVDEMDIVVDEI